MSDLVERLRWLDSPDAERISDYQRINEFCKSSHEAADRIEALEAVARLSRELLIELDTYWSGVSGPSLSGIMLDWRNKYRILLEDENK